MSQFSFAQYNSAVSAAQNKTSNVKVGFFKLSNDGDEALVRINLASVDELQFASVHTVSASGKWLKVSCLNPFGSYNDGCELCRAVADGNAAISKASKKVYLQMMVAYKDQTTGQWSAPVPVIWERPAGFSREIANKLRDYGNLKEVILKITRNGVAGDMKTTYSLDFIPLYNKPELIPVDFSAFNNFKISKHSYWEKTEEEIHTFLTTGSFPEAERVEAPAVAPTYTSSTAQPAAPVYTAPVAPTEQSQPAQTTPGGFRF